MTNIEALPGEKGFAIAAPFAKATSEACHAARGGKPEKQRPCVPGAGIRAQSRMLEGYLAA